MGDNLTDRLQRVCEKRLTDAGIVYDVRENEADPADYGVTMAAVEFAESNLAGAYDGCDTCQVREVLDAAFGVLRDLTPQERTDFMREVWGMTDVARIDQHPNLLLIGRL